jgi:hypothetical protein
MTAAHFIYIPSILLLGIVIGWILGSRAAADAYACPLRSVTLATALVASACHVTRRHEGTKI